MSKSTLNFNVRRVAAHFYFNFTISFCFTFLRIFLLSYEPTRQIKEEFENKKHNLVSFKMHSGTINFKHNSLGEIS